MARRDLDAALPDLLALLESCDAPYNSFAVPHLHEVARVDPAADARIWETLARLEERFLRTVGDDDGRADQQVLADAYATWQKPARARLLLERTRQEAPSRVVELLFAFVMQPDLGITLEDADVALVTAEVLEAARFAGNQAPFPARRGRPRARERDRARRRRLRRSAHRLGPAVTGAASHRRRARRPRPPGMPRPGRGGRGA